MCQSVYQEFTCQNGNALYWQVVHSAAYNLDETHIHGLSMPTPIWDRNS